MAYREVSRMEIQEVIRRWQAGASPGRIATGTGLSRNTARKYVAAAKAEGIAQDGPAATEEQLSRLAMVSQSGPRQSTTPRQDQLEPWADQIYQWIANDRLQMTRIHELLTIRGCAVSYPSLRRFVLKRNWRKRSKTTVRMEDTPPGEVAEADFGRLGMITDPETGRRKAVWAMVIVLCHSRHCFVWPMQSQQLEDVISGLEALLARVFLARRVSDLIEINELNADASELDNANPDSWSAMPKVAKDFQSLRLRDDEVDEPASRDDSELEDCDGIAVF